MVVTILLRRLEVNSVGKKKRLERGETIPDILKFYDIRNPSDPR